MPGGSADPCWGDAPSLTLAQCERTGVTEAQYNAISRFNPAAQTNTIQGGNSGLTPEIADTFTVGLVVQPRIIPNLVVSVDAFNIKIRSAIEELSSTTIINACGTLGSLCDLIHRGPNGSLWQSPNYYVVATEQNVGSILTRGADISSHYLQDIGFLGKLAFNLTGTYTKDFNTVSLPGQTAYNCTGYAGNTCGSPQPLSARCYRRPGSRPGTGRTSRCAGASSVPRRRKAQVRIQSWLPPGFTRE